MGGIAAGHPDDVGALPRPFAWTGVPPDVGENAGRQRPTKRPRETRTRLRGAAGFLAPYYAALRPIVPREVRQLRPTEVAALLGLDRQLAVMHNVRALRDGEFVDLQADAMSGVPQELWTPPETGQTSDAPRQRLRKVY